MSASLMMTLRAMLGLGSREPTAPNAGPLPDDVDELIHLREQLGWGQRPQPNARHWRPVTAREHAALYDRPDSFTDLLPYTDYLPEHQAFVLEDGRSVAALFELIPIGCEARSPEFLEALHGRIETVLCQSIPEEEDSPWVVQMYVQDDPFAVRRMAESVRHYAGRHGGGGRILSEHYFAELERHLDLICRPHGLFLDEQVTGQIWKGQRRRVRIALYRRQPKRRKGREATPDSILRALHNATSRFKSGLDSLGIEARRCTGADLYEWLLPWLTPYPSAYGGDAMRLLSALPYPEDAFRLPYGRDLAEWLTHSMPVSDYETRTWWFDAKPHAIVSTQALEQRPEIGHFTRERENGARLFALQDKLPEGSVLAITWVCKVQDEVKAHIFRLRETSKGGSIEAEATRDDCDTALRLLEGGHKCFPCQLSVFIRADQIQQLEDRRRDVETLLHQSGIKPIAAESDLLGLESYVRHLPFNYCPELDKKARRSRLTFSYDLAGMVPFYGRSRGTGNPGFLFFNRGGEDMTFDPLSRMDRTKNGHLLLLGPSGAGKSAMLVYLILQAIAVHNPRVFLIEAGNSFGLLTQYLANYGLTTHQVRLDARNRAGISLCPFLDAIRALEQQRQSKASPDDERDASDDTDDGDENRDILGEMEIAARIMITGGEEEEARKFTRSDRFNLRNAILLAASNVQARGGEQVVTEDVVQGLREMAQDATLNELQRNRLSEMANGLAMFTQGTEGLYFNRPGDVWPVCDVTHMDMGLFAREGYEANLTVSYVGLMNRINALVEAQQHEGRPTIVITDEGHIITTNPLLAPYVVKLTKMWRKLGTWLWIATQNMRDFPDASEKMLSMMEWWVLLTMPQDEIDQIARFRKLTAEQRDLMLSTRKEPGKFVEGVVLADKVQALFRNVVPPIALALAMTENEEKAERGRLMKRFGISELEAAERIAAQIEQARRDAVPGEAV